jgi:hypothetical protein
VPSSTSTTIAGTTTTTLGPTIQVQPATVVAGSSTVVSGGGFPPGSQLQVNLFSNSVLLGTTTANSLGQYQVSVTVPSGTAPGVHTVVVSTASGTQQAQTTLTVVAPTTSTTAGSLSLTGANVRGPGVLALLLVGAGILSLAVTWRRRPAGWTLRRRR